MSPQKVTSRGYGVVTSMLVPDGWELRDSPLEQHYMINLTRKHAVLRLSYLGKTESTDVSDLRKHLQTTHGETAEVQHETCIQLSDKLPGYEMLVRYRLPPSWGPRRRHRYHYLASIKRGYCLYGLELVTYRPKRDLKIWSVVVRSIRFDGDVSAICGSLDPRLFLSYSGAAERVEEAASIVKDSLRAAGIDFYDYMYDDSVEDQAILDRLRTEVDASACSVEVVARDMDDRYWVLVEHRLLERSHVRIRIQLCLDLWNVIRGSSDDRLLRLNFGDGRLGWLETSAWREPEKEPFYRSPEFSVLTRHFVKVLRTALRDDDWSTLRHMEAVSLAQAGRTIRVSENIQIAPRDPPRASLARELGLVDDNLET